MSKSYGADYKPAGIFISNRELERLIRAQTERDLILGLAARKGLGSYQIDELLRVLMKINGVIPEGEEDA
ncbi:MAG: hypothetical protein J6J62_02430 [Oscillospiraceae bacterium]|nr:hypothetical protein [Oscillospiraceae bacterium]